MLRGGGGSRSRAEQQQQRAAPDGGRTPIWGPDSEASGKDWIWGGSFWQGGGEASSLRLFRQVFLDGRRPGKFGCSLATDRREPLRAPLPEPAMSIMDHSPTTGVVTVIVILIAIAALGALILGCWCYLRLQRISQSEDEESIVGEGETKEPFLLVQYSARGPCTERKAKLTPNGTEAHS
ncbi:UNVERIFIED_CONTAM: hypothetical protein K2H54_017585 [Gekko kuhli]